MRNLIQGLHPATPPQPNYQEFAPTIPNYSLGLQRASITGRPYIDLPGGIFSPEHYSVIYPLPRARHLDPDQKPAPDPLKVGCCNGTL